MPKNRASKAMRCLIYFQNQRVGTKLRGKTKDILRVWRGVQRVRGTRGLNVVRSPTVKNGLTVRVYGSNTWLTNGLADVSVTLLAVGGLSSSVERALLDVIVDGRLKVVLQNGWQEKGACTVLRKNLCCGTARKLWGGKGGHREGCRFILRKIAETLRPRRDGPLV